MWRLVLSLAIAVAATTLVANPAFAQLKPELKLGFATLAALAPDVVGEPLENEQHNPVTGDAIQRTTRGILVWRKADNVAAFTDGSTTWLLGPSGLQSRPNGLLFGWEAPATLVSLSDGAVSLAFSRNSNGGWVGRGTARNPTREALDVEINIVGFDSPNGSPVIDAPTLFLEALAPGESRPITVRVPTPEEVGHWKWLVAARGATVDGPLRMDVGTARSLDVDPLLAGTVQALRRVDDGEWLVRVAAEHGVEVIRRPTGFGVLGHFDPAANRVSISTLLDSSSVWVRATVLAHELQHAAGAAAGQLPKTTAQCYRFETEAFQRQSIVWSELWRGNLPPDVDVFHAELNDVATTVARNPEVFALQLVARYRAECGLLGR